MPRVLVDIENNHAIQTLTPEQFFILQNCNGEVDLQMNDICKKLLEDGIIIENINNKKLKEAQKYHYFDNRHFSTVRWGITSRCNYKCRHCFMAEGKENSNYELPLDKCLNIVNQIADCGIESVILTGGEPLLRKDFFDIIDELLKRNININAINTNGSLITNNFLNELNKRKIKPAFSVSFDGIGYHDWMRGVNGAEKQAIDAIKLLVKNGFYVIAVCCIHQGNIHILKDTVELMNNLGVNRVEVYRTAETLRWNSSPVENKSLSYKDCYDAYMDLLYTHKNRDWNVSFYLKDFCRTDNKANITQIVPSRCSNNSDFSKDFACPSVRSMLFIAPNGQALPCNAYTGYTLKHKWPFENLQNIQLKDILKQSIYLNYVLTSVKDLFENNKECKNCKYSQKCMGGHCRLIALASTGSFYGKDESTCAFFEGNYEEKIKDFMKSNIKKQLK